jgi:hypothetical protein
MSCGRESEGDFAFCLHCRAELTKSAVGSEDRLPGFSGERRGSIPDFTNREIEIRR